MDDGALWSLSGDRGMELEEGKILMSSVLVCSICARILQHQKFS